MYSLLNRVRPTIESPTLGTTLILIRQIAVQLLGIITGIVLARHLSVAEFGMYAALLFQYFLHLGIGDLGLGGSVIRQADTPTRDTLRLVFSTRLILDSCQCLVIWFLSPLLAQQYGNGGAELSWAFRAVAFAALLQSGQVVPTIGLERKLRFGWLTLIEVLQACTFSGICIAAALSNATLLWLGVAWLGHSLVGTILCSLVNPWPVGLHFNWQAVRPRLAFSLPYQGNHLALLFRDSTIPVAVGFIAGASAVGSLSWALTFSLSISAGTMALQRVFLPLFARAQTNTEELSRAVSNCVFLCYSLVVPLTLTVLLLREPITRVIFGEQWLPMLPLVVLFWLANIAIPVLPPFLALYNALGNSRASLRFTVELSCIIFVFSLLGLNTGSLEGFAAGYALAHCYIAVLAMRVSKIVTWNWFRFALMPWWIAAAPTTGLYLLNVHHPAASISSLIIYGALFVFVFALSVLALHKTGWKLLPSSSASQSPA